MMREKSSLKAHLNIQKRDDEEEKNEVPMCGNFTFAIFNIVCLNDDAHGFSVDSNS